MSRVKKESPILTDLRPIIDGIKNVIDRIRVRSSIAFNYTYENDGRDVVNHKEVTADGNEASNGHYDRTPSYSFEKSYFHAFITFIGLPSRIGDEGFTLLQFGRDLIGGWNPLPRKSDGSLAWSEFNSKNWLNILGSIFLIKTLLIPAIKFATWPIKFAINILKFGTEDLPLTLESVFEDLSNYMLESFYSAWKTTQSFADPRPRALFGFVKLIKLVILGSLFVGSYLSSWAFSIVHSFGMLLTSPDKSRRYWYQQGQILSRTTFLGYIPGSSYILPYVLSGLSIAFSTLTWAVIFPMAVSAVTAFFPAVLPVVTSLTKLPFIASSLTMISGTVISVSTTIAGIIAPAFAAINVIAATVGIQVTATSLAVGFSLGAIAAFSSIVLTYIADKTSNLWAIFKGVDTVGLLQAEIDQANLNACLSERNLTQSPDDYINVLIKTIFDPAWSMKLEERCNRVADAIHKLIIYKSPNDRRKFAAAIEQKIYSYRNKPDFKNNLKALEKQLKISASLPHDSSLNWKDIIYYANYTRVMSARATKLQVNFNSETPIDKNSRQKESSINRGDLSDPDSNIVAATTGTTFFTNSQQVLVRSEKSALNSNLSVTHVMDSCLIAEKNSVHDGEDKIYLAMADGLGGHTGDKAEDTRISRASYFGCKHAIRLCSTYDDADTLKANLKTIIQHVGAEILIKNNGSRESTSLTCATVFAVPTNWGQPQKQRVIGANIGDSMLVAWDPKTNTVTTLLPGRHLVQSIGQGPAHLPANYDVETDLDIVDVTLEQGTVLIPFTDGMLGKFNTITNEETKNGKNYNVYHINPNWILPILDSLKRDASAKDIVNTLMQHVMDQTERDRTALIQQAESAKMDLTGLAETQKADREKLAHEKAELDSGFQEIFDKKEKKEISDEEYTQKREPLQQRRTFLDEQCSDLNVARSALEAKTQITYGDDITVMAVRLQ